MASTASVALRGVVAEHREQQIETASRLRSEIVATRPKSTNAMRPSPSAKMFPACGSAW